jgi:putative copper export protein
MPLETVILWIHALAGAGWVAACVCFVIAGLVLSAGGDEQRDFALGAAPRIVAFSLAAALLLVFTGAVNLILAGIVRNFRFSSEFGRILVVKIVLFVVMFLALRWTLRAAASLPNDAQPAAPTNALAHRMAGLVRAQGAIAVLGAVALLLGLWLMGT